MSFAAVDYKDLPQGIDDLLNKTKGSLFFKKAAGFMGTILANCTTVWTRDIETACINPKTLYWNPDFFMSLDPNSRITVLAHELWHVGMLHGVRLGDKCPDYWNIAADHVINNLLQDHGYYMGGFPYLMDPKFKNMSSDEVYDIIFKPGSKPKQNPGALGGDIIAVTGNDVNAAITTVVQARSVDALTGSGIGSLPDEITMTIDKFLNPKLPWETLLFNFMNALSCQEYSFARPNRRFDDPIMPGLMPRNGLEHLIYYVDISGSISDEQVLRMNSEIKGVKEQLDPERITLVTFDTEIHDIYEFTQDDPFEKIVIVGRGGTDLTEVFAHAKEHAPTAMIVFTDLEVDIPPHPGIPILWIIQDNPKVSPPYGVEIHCSSK